MDSFWEKGPEMYAKALGEEYQAAEARLKAQMQECQTDIRRQALAEELETLRKDYESRLRGMDWSLF